jgi:CRP-like cAMP-binding protein
MSAPEAAVLLRASAVFAGLPAREIDAVAAVAQEARHRAREYVFMEGDAARWLYVVKTGRVKIVRQSRAGRDVVLELLGPGEVFGAPIPPRPRRWRRASWFAFPRRPSWR